jgi:hypothetical protein
MYEISLSGTGLNDVLALPLSVGQGFLTSKSFSNWKKQKEAEQKTQFAIINAVNGVIRSIGAIHKSFRR